MTPGLYPKIGEAAYHADPSDTPSLSASIAHILLTQSPRHAWWHHPELNPDWKADEPSKQMDMGTACHALLLENDDSRIVVVAADNYQTKAAREARDAARLVGKTPLLFADFMEAKQVAAAGRQQLANSEIAGILDDGDAECTAIWDDAGVACRSRLDFITSSRAIVVDYKTRSGTAEPGAFMRAILNEGYDLQGAFYRRGVKKLTGVEPRFVYIVQETSPPYLLSLVGL